MFKVNTVSPRRRSRTPVTLTQHDAIERAARDYSNLLLLYVMIDFAELKIVSLLGAKIILALKKGQLGSILWHPVDSIALSIEGFVKLTVDV